MQSISFASCTNNRCSRHQHCTTQLGRKGCIVGFKIDEDGGLICGSCIIPFDQGCDIDVQQTLSPRNDRNNRNGLHESQEPKVNFCEKQRVQRVNGSVPVNVHVLQLETKKAAAVLRVHHLLHNVLLCVRDVIEVKNAVSIGVARLAAPNARRTRCRTARAAPLPMMFNVTACCDI